MPTNGRVTFKSKRDSQPGPIVIVFLITFYSIPIASLSEYPRIIHPTTIPWTFNWSLLAHVFIYSSCAGAVVFLKRDAVFGIGRSC